VRAARLAVVRPLDGPAGLDESGGATIGHFLRIYSLVSTEIGYHLKVYPSLGVLRANIHVLPEHLSINIDPRFPVVGMTTPKQLPSFLSPSALSCAVLAVTDAVIRKADRASWIIGRISMPEDHSAGRKDEDDRADLDENGGLLLEIDWRRVVTG
jgi:hypothetical protein